MAFFKKVKKKINGLWYPQSVTVGKPVDTDQVADRLAQISTVSPSDTYAVLKGLGGVLGDFMAQGRTVKLDGVGTFYYTSVANGQGVDSPEKVKATLITGARVRFIPETSRTSGNKIATRSLVSNNIFWEEWGGKSSDNSSEGGNGGDGGEDDRPVIE
nr:HU family DNA-binding protein [Parabacteroides goldsteinii]